jgi:hypothetical protein
MAKSRAALLNEDEIASLFRKHRETYIRERAINLGGLRANKAKARCEYSEFSLLVTRSLSNVADMRTRLESLFPVHSNDGILNMEGHYKLIRMTHLVEMLKIVDMELRERHFPAWTFEYPVIDYTYYQPEEEPAKPRHLRLVYSRD